MQKTSSGHVCIFSVYFCEIIYVKPYEITCAYFVRYMAENNVRPCVDVCEITCSQRTLQDHAA